MHQRVASSFSKSENYMPDQVVVPRCFWYATPKDDKFWNVNLERFPETKEFPRKPRYIMCMERIFPLPERIRNKLIEDFCPEAAQQQARQHDANRDCLIVPVLGRNKHAGQRFFNLRNFNTHSDQMEAYELDAARYARSMGHALAVLHWHTHVDGNDIEFVSGSSPTEEQQVRVALDPAKIQKMDAHTSTYEIVTLSQGVFTKRNISLWVIDFDACNKISATEAGVDMAVKAFMEMKFCPKPNSDDEFIDYLWQEFLKVYQQHSERLLGAKNQNLLAFFLDKVSAQTKATSERRRGATERSRSGTYPPGSSLPHPSAGPGTQGGQSQRSQAEGTSHPQGSGHSRGDSQGGGQAWRKTGQWATSRPQASQSQGGLSQASGQGGNLTGQGGPSQAIQGTGTSQPGNVRPRRGPSQTRAGFQPRPSPLFQSETASQATSASQGRGGNPARSTRGSSPSRGNRGSSGSGLMRGTSPSRSRGGRRGSQDQGLATQRTLPNNWRASERGQAEGKGDVGKSNSGK